MEIDLVYCWCNGAEFAAREKCRYSNNGELFHSLKSVDKYAPWFRTIWVFVNDGTEIPDWLLSHPKVKIVKHSEVIPKEILPLYSSQAIEMWLAKIPGLSEKFVYANDDMFIAREITPEFFFDKRGRMICRFACKFDKPKEVYAKSVMKGRALLKSKMKYGPHHNMDGYLKSVIEDFARHFPEEWRSAASSRERSAELIQRDVFAIWAMKTGRGVFRRACRPRWVRLFGMRRWETLYCDLSRPWVKKVIDRDNVALYCLNDSEETTDENREEVKEWLSSRL